VTAKLSSIEIQGDAGLAVLLPSLFPIPDKAALASD